MTPWWLVTWTTYGTWLPGDPRGFRTWRGREHVPPPRRYAKPGQATYDPAVYGQRHESAQEAAKGVVTLTIGEQKTTLHVIINEIALVAIRPAAMSVGPTHVHLLAQFGSLMIRPTVGRLKAAATRALQNPSTRVWAKNCHMASKRTPDQFTAALNYVRHHVNEQCLVYCWTQADDFVVGLGHKSLISSPDDPP